MYKKIKSFLYTYFLKIIYFKRIELNGFVIFEGSIKIHVEKNSKLIIKGNIHLRDGCQIIVRNGALCMLGKNIFFNRYCSLVCRNRIEIYDNVMLGESVKIYDNNHLFNKNHIYGNKFKTNKITIHEKSWIGNNVNILSGSIVQSNSIIGCMSLVNKNLEKSGVYIGIPVQLIKERK